VTKNNQRDEILGADKIRMVDPKKNPIITLGHYWIMDQEKVIEVTNKTAAGEKRNYVAPPSIGA
jgi:hypothetical protein